MNLETRLVERIRELSDLITQAKEKKGNAEELYNELEVVLTKYTNLRRNSKTQ